MCVCVLLVNNKKGPSMILKVGNVYDWASNTIATNTSDTQHDDDDENECTMPDIEEKKPPPTPHINCERGGFLYLS